MKKTLVKSKIVLEDNGTSLVIYLWKPIFWIFGYWYPFGSSCGTKFSKEELDNINDNNTSRALFNEFLKHRCSK